MSERTDTLLTDAIESRLVATVQEKPALSDFWRDKGRKAEADLRVEIARLEVRIAELEAAARPVPFSERLPAFDQTVLVWNGKHWFRVQDWGQEHLDDMEPRYTHWLPWPTNPPEVQP